MKVINVFRVFCFFLVFTGYLFADVRNIQKIIVNKGDFLKTVSSFQGIPYVWGGTSRKGLDCSGFSKILYSKFGVILPRVSRDQAKTGFKIMNKNDLTLGDLVFFYKFNNPKQINHVGIYISKNRFVHAAPKKGVIISSLSSPKYSYTYAFGRRVSFFYDKPTRRIENIKRNNKNLFFNVQDKTTDDYAIISDLTIAYNNYMSVLKVLSEMKVAENMNF